MKKYKIKNATPYGVVCNKNKMTKDKNPELHEMLEESTVLPLQETEFFKHYKHILSKKEIPEHSFDCLILDYLLGFDRDVGIDQHVDKSRQANYELFMKLVEKYPNAISVTRDKRDKEYLDDMSNYGVTPDGKNKPNFEAKDKKPTIDRYGIENGKTVKLTPEELKPLVEIAEMPMSEEDKKKIKDFMENHKTVIL